VIPLAVAAVALAAIAAVFVWARRSPRGDDRLYRELDGAVPGKTPRRREITRGAATEGWKVTSLIGHRGVLALYDDELVFVVDGEPARIPLSAIREVTRVRSVESFMARKNPDDEKHRDPQWMLKIEWRNGDEYETATWGVAEPDDWIGELPRRPSPNR